MKRKVFIYGTVLLLLVSMREGCAVVNTLVSLPYETSSPRSPSACLSSVTGTDLGAALAWHKAVALGRLAGYAALLAVAAVLDKRRVQ